MRVAAVQTNFTSDRGRNLRIAGELVRAAAEGGATFIVLPEKFNSLGAGSQAREMAEALDGPTMSWAAELARGCGVWLVAGSILEKEVDRDKVYNTSVLLDPQGNRKAAYRKIHMFDVEVDGISYRESELTTGGTEIVTAAISPSRPVSDRDPSASPLDDRGENLDDRGENRDDILLGMAVCYDLRFPELFRILAIEGADIIALPSAFTMMTGKDHWQVLLQARAIENQVFLVAANQVGANPGHHPNYGRSMIVDPWGVVLAVAPDSECFISADLDFELLHSVRDKLPSLANRRPEAYKWPQD